MTIDPMQFLIVSLGVWRLSYMLVYETGAWGVIERLRDWFTTYDERSNCMGRGGVGGVFCCVFCMSVWLGMFASIIVNSGQPIVHIILHALAYSGLASLIQMTVNRMK